MSYKRLACERCGRGFVSETGTEMLTVLTGGCPRCGGAFVLDGELAELDPVQAPSAELGERNAGVTRVLRVSRMTRQHR